MSSLILNLDIHKYLYIICIIDQPQPIQLSLVSFTFNHKTNSVLLSLWGVGNIAWKKENLVTKNRRGFIRVTGVEYVFKGSSDDRSWILDIILYKKNRHKGLLLYLSLLDVHISVFAMLHHLQAHVSFQHIEKLQHKLLFF